MHYATQQIFIARLLLEVLDKIKLRKTPLCICDYYIFGRLPVSIKFLTIKSLCDAMVSLSQGLS